VATTANLVGGNGTSSDSFTLDQGRSLSDSLHRDTPGATLSYSIDELATDSYGMHATGGNYATSLAAGGTGRTRPVPV